MTALCLMLVGAGTLVWQYQLTLAPTLKPLFARKRLTDDQFARAMAALNSAELSGHAVRDGELWVPQGKESAYFAALVEAGAVPPELQATEASALEKASLFDSERDRQRRMEYALERDLAIAIESMRGVEKAMVQYDELTRRGFRTEPILTASVSVAPSQGCRLRARQVDAIRQMVASAKAGLKPEAIVVTDLGTETSYYGELEDNRFGATSEEQLEWKADVESRWEAKILRTLNHISDVRVTVDAKLAVDETRWQQIELLSVAVSVPQTYYHRWMEANSAENAKLSLDDVRREIDTQIRSTLSLLIEGRSTDDHQVATTEHEDADNHRTLDRDSRPTQVGLKASVAVIPYSDTLAGEGVVQRVAGDSQWMAFWQRHRMALIGVVSAGLAVGLVSRWLRQPQPHSSDSTLSIEDYRDATAEPSGTTGKTDAALVETEQLRQTLTGVVRSNPEAAAEVLNRWIDQAG